jgi:hypothetical protein
MAPGDEFELPPAAHVSATDLAIYGAILGLGALQYALPQQGIDFYKGDVVYFKLARSLIERGTYEFNFKPETMLPPGFPAIVAGICMAVGCAHQILLRSIAVFATLGLVASYELLRREQGRMVAAVSCLLLSSSPVFFAVVTQYVFSDLPYFFVSITTLLLATRLDAATGRAPLVALWVLCSLSLIGSSLIRSSGIALLAGLSLWLCASVFVGRRIAARRIRRFLPMLILGIVVQAFWMHWAATHEILQWPTVDGYPKSYLAQLRVKDANYPELGLASLNDIPPRIANNLAHRAAALTSLITRIEYVNPVWFSPLIFGPIALVLIGLGSSVWRHGGGFPEWYFVSHEAIYLLWPWSFDVRFFLPVAPLALLYLWRGGRELLALASERSRVVGTCSFFFSMFLSVYAVASGWAARSLQAKYSAIFWAVAAAVSVWTLSGRAKRHLSTVASLLGTSISIGRKGLPLIQFGWALVLSAAVGAGIAGQLSIGRENLSFDATKYPGYPDIEAARWIRSQTAPDIVVMARLWLQVHHFAERKVVWFPPSSDPSLLMAGIRRNKVDLIIVTNRKDHYFLPPDQDCFEHLLTAYPTAFRVIGEGPQFKIFAVAPVMSR